MYRPLMDTELYKFAPSIFAEEKHGSRSEKYTYIPTIEVLNGLRKEGFEPFLATQSRARDESKRNFTKHMIRLRHTNQFADKEACEIVLINSHDGTSSYQMMCGIFRLVCENGMVLGDTVEDIRIPHRGDIIGGVVDAAYSIVDDFDTAQESMETMKSTQLAFPEAEAFASAALTLKYDEVEKAPISPTQVLSARRSIDAKEDLWSTFNRVQENVIKGGLRGRSATGRRVSTRPVKSIENNIKLNKALWVLATQMAALKN
ncbi:MAG: DUF945 domain-containing protein [Firmicutes bacterium]|nr:DUF945 domain-containing protein [Bacillota bacterium]